MKILAAYVLNLWQNKRKEIREIIAWKLQKAWSNYKKRNRMDFIPRLALYYLS